MQQKSIPLRKNIINITKFIKTKSLNNTTHTLRNPLRHMRDKDGDREKEKGVSKDCKGMLIMKNYKNEHNGHSHGVSWEKPHG
jgi:hypothetical protein